jgi:hypothetical protein
MQQEPRQREKRMASMRVLPQGTQPFGMVIEIEFDRFVVRNLLRIIW